MSIDTAAPAIVVDEFVIWLPGTERVRTYEGARFLSAAVMSGAYLTLWAEVDTSRPVRDYQLCILSAGPYPQRVPPGMSYLATATDRLSSGRADLDDLIVVRHVYVDNEANIRYSH